MPAIYDLGEDYIAMEHVEGHPLSDLIAEAAPLPSGWVAAIGLQIAAVLSAAHRVSLIHRDLKPSNVVLMPTGAVKVVDFGVATLVDESLSTLTPPGVVPGTNRYQAPERQFGLTGRRSDLYSLGCVLHELGAPSTVVSFLTAHDPADRPADATAVITLLRPALGPVSLLPGFVADPAAVPALTEAYLALASASASRASDRAGLDPHQVRAQVERLNAAGQAEQAVALLDAALASGPAVNLQRDLTGALFEAGDFRRAAVELRALLPALVTQVGRPTTPRSYRPVNGWPRRWRTAATRPPPWPNTTVCCPTRSASTDRRPGPCSAPAALWLCCVLSWATAGLRSIC